MHNKLWKSLTLFIICLSISACRNDPAEAMLSDYIKRVSHVLEIPLEIAEQDTQIPAWPERRQRLLALTDLREGILEVWDFRQCDMMQLIAERNSSLGKIMAPSQRMRYELRFLAALQQCIQKLQSQETLEDTQKAFLKRLQSIREIKQRDLPKVIWNGIYMAEEISAHFALGKSPLPLDGNYHEPVQQALQKLATISKLSQSKELRLPQWLDKIEDTYYAFYSSELGARLLPSLHLLTHYLNQTAQQIETRLKQKPFCYPGHKTRKADFLFNIFTRYYAGKVQPYMVVVQREGQRWLQHHEQIMQTLPRPEAMHAYYQQVISMTYEQGIWRQWQIASQRHSKAWQAILSQCDLMPGS